MIIPDDKTPFMPPSPFRPSIAWNTGPCEPDTPVRAFTVDRRGPFCLSFRVVFRDGSWFNATTGEKLECEIAGWAP